MVMLIPKMEQLKAEEPQAPEAPRRRISPALIAVIAVALAVGVACLLVS